jgi:hypothetical protein
MFLPPYKFQSLTAVNVEVLTYVLSITYDLHNRELAEGNNSLIRYFMNRMSHMYFMFSEVRNSVNNDNCKLQALSYDTVRKYIVYTSIISIF